MQNNKTMNLWNKIHQLKIAGLFVLSFLPINGFSQSPKELAESFMTDYLDYKINPKVTEKILQANAQKIINGLVPYLSDSLVRARTGAYWMISKAGSASDDAQARQQAVKILVDGLGDSDGGIAGSVISSLQGFKPSDFNSEQRYIISMKVKAVPLVPHLDKLILLSGYIGIEELIYNLKSMLIIEDLYGKKEKWNMKLAMARMGDASAISEVIGRIGALRVSDNVVYDVYPSLAYVRQKQAFDILLDIILSDEKNCLSSNPDNEAEIICAYRVMGFTAQYIEGFPLDVDQFGEPIIDNYEQALTTVRQWINENRDNYQLIKDVY